MTTTTTTSPKTRGMLFSAPMVRAILAGKKTMTRRIIEPQPLDDRGVRWCNRWEDWHGRKVKQPFATDDLLYVKEQLIISDCGNYLCRHLGSGNYEAWTRDGKTHWQHDGRPQDHPRAEYPLEFCIGGYSNLSHRAKNRFELYLLRCNTRKKVIPLSGNTVIESRDVQFRRLWPSIFMPRWASRITLKVIEVRAERLQAITEGDAKAEGFTPVSYRDGRGTESARHAFRTLWNEINGKSHPWESNPWVWVYEFEKVD